MPQPGAALEKLGFLTIGLFDGQDPGPGHQVTLEMIELGERLGFDAAWVRCRHLQYGISSPVAVLAAAAQRTSRIELGTAVIPLGWENPLRLAEDLATVDILSGGRLNPGFSVGPPMNWPQVREALYPDTADAEDFSYERVSRLLRFVAGETAASLPAAIGFEQFSSRVEPHSPGLRSRMWYGAGSLASAKWAGETRGEPADVVRGEGGGDRGRGPADFAQVQLSQIRTFRDQPPGRAGGAGLPGARGDTDRLGLARAAREVRGVRRGADAAHRRADRPRPDDVRARHPRPLGERSPRHCTRTWRSARSPRSRSRCRSPSSTRTTCRYSPTSRPASARRSAGRRRS